MATKITRDIIESYLNCKYKGHLKLTSESGTISDYEAMTTAARTSSGEQALTRLAARFGKGAGARRAVVTAALLNELRDLGAAELTEVLRGRLAAMGGLAIEAERRLARGVVRRARRAEQLQEVLQRVLWVGEALAVQGDCSPAWQAAAALTREVLRAGRARPPLPS
jgi:hypothetical protein